MLKPTKSFKITKEVKRRLARYVDSHKRGEYKRAMIDALLTAEQTAKKLPRENRNQPNVPDLDE